MLFCFPPLNISKETAPTAQWTPARPQKSSCTQRDVVAQVTVRASACEKLEPGGAAVPPMPTRWHTWWTIEWLGDPRQEIVMGIFVRARTFGRTAGEP